MFGILFESRRARKRQVRYTAASIGAHAAVIVAAVVATASAEDGGRKPLSRQVTTVYVPVSRQQPSDRPAVRPASPEGPADPGAVPGIPAIELPRIEPGAVLPPLDLATGDITAGIEADIMEGGRGGSMHGAVAGERSTGPVDGVRGAHQVERPAALAGRAKLPYPPLLRASGVEGQVKVRFVVDTLGRVEPQSVEVREASHEQFAASARQAVARLRFSPARVGGRPVRQLVELPFVFTLRR